MLLEHEYMPKAEVLSKDEAKSVLNRLRAMPFQLPWIRSSDPLAKALGAKPGDILRIIRESPSAGRVEVYRFVVPG